MHPLNNPLSGLPFLLGLVGRCVKGSSAFFLVCLLLFSTFLNANQADPVIHIEDAADIIIGEKLHTFPDGKMTWQQVVAQPIENGIPSKVEFYNADSHGMPLWIRTDVKTGSINPSDQWLMGLGSGFAGDLEFYVVANGQLIDQKTHSSKWSFDKRAIDNRLLYFPLTLPSHADIQLLIKILQSPIPHYKPSITTVELMEKEETKWMAWMGFAIGFLVAIGLYHLVLASATSDKAYTYYFLYVFGSALWVLTTHGLGFAYLWPNDPWVSQFISIYFYYAPVLASFFFVIHFLNLPKLSRKFTRFYYGFALIFFLSITLKVLVPEVSLDLLSLQVIIAYLSFIYAGFYARRKGVDYARYFNIAWTLYSLSIVNMMFYVSGLPAFLANKTYWVAVVVFDVQVLLLAFALAYRIRSIRRSKLEAEADNRAQSEFLARMSHEIRTPLNGVLGMAELLVDRLKDKTDLYYLNIIRSSGSSLLTIINDILDYSKFTSGKMELENIPFNVQRLAVESFDVFKIKAAEKNVELIADIDFDIPKVVQGDPTRIKQIMLNFISNAIKFTEQGQVVLRVYPEKNQTDILKISVTDSGEGISTEGQKKLFNAFSQTSKSTSRKYGGTGLGLSICKQLAELMGGEIGVESEEGKGSTFWVKVYLPASSEILPDENIADMSLEGYNLLIVEDNYTFAELLFNQASSWGMYCQVANNGTEALSLLRQNHQIGKTFDLISLDLAMPKMDGIETSKHIFADPRFNKIPMLLLTSATNFPSKTVLASSGIQRVIEKPTLPSDVQRVYKELLIKEEVPDQDQPLNVTEEDELLPELSILVAEDNKVNQLIIQGILKRLHQKVVLVENGKLAYETALASHEEFDLILMDYDMPEMNGIDATIAIRKWEIQENLQPVKIVALTAHAVQSYIDECLSAGMDGYLSKPIDIKQLESLLKEMFVLEANN